MDEEEQPIVNGVGSASEEEENEMEDDWIKFLLFHHSSEIRGLCFMKWPSKMLQNLPYFIYMKTRYLFQQISKFLKDSMDVFYGTRTLKSIVFTIINWF